MSVYQKYQDSCVYYLGKLPAHWQVKRAKTLFKKEQRPIRPNDGVVTCFRDGQVTLRTNRRTEGFTNSLKEIGYQGVRKGDLVIHNMDAFAGSIGVSESDGKMSPVCSICTPIHANVLPIYYALYLRALARDGFVKSLAKGIRERSTDFRYGEFKELFLPLPPLPEQEAIVRYLDAETAKIDKAIAAEEKMIALLQERREIIINEAVGGGEDFNAEAQSRGGWKMRRLGAIGTFSKGGGISRDDLREEGLPAILYGDIYTKYNISTEAVANRIDASTAKCAVRICKGDILITGSGETKEDIGKTIAFLGEEAYIGGDVILFRQNGNDSKFLSYALSCSGPKAFRYRESKGEIIVHIYSSVLKSLTIPLPPLPEQERIVKYLDAETGKIDRAIEVKRRQIALLRERREIVINEVVTGRVSLAERGSAKPVLQGALCAPKGGA